MENVMGAPEEEGEDGGRDLRRRTTTTTTYARSRTRKRLSLRVLRRSHLESSPVRNGRIQPSSLVDRVEFFAPMEAHLAVGGLDTREET